MLVFLPANFQENTSWRQVVLRSLWSLGRPGNYIWNSLVFSSIMFNSNILRCKRTFMKDSQTFRNASSFFCFPSFLDLHNEDETHPKLFALVTNMQPPSIGLVSLGCQWKQSWGNLCCQLGSLEDGCCLGIPLAPNFLDDPFGSKLVQHDSCGLSGGSLFENDLSEGVVSELNSWFSLLEVRRPSLRIESPWTKFSVVFFLSLSLYDWLPRPWFTRKSKSIPSESLFLET